MRVTSSPEARRLAFFAALVLLLVAGAAGAAAAAGALGVEAEGAGSGKREASAAPVRIRADRAHARSVRESATGKRRDLIVFEGDVEVARGEMTLHCARAELVFLSSGGEKRVAERVDATGGVRLVTPTRRAEGERLLYEAVAGRVTLTGPPRPAIRQGGDVIRADSFVYYPDEDRFEAAGFVAARLAARPAEGAPTAEETIVSREKETLVECAGGASWDRPLGQGVFREDVRVRQEGFELACDELYVVTEEVEERLRRVEGGGEPTRTESHRVRRLAAVGNVRLTTKTRTATGTRAVYDPEAKVFEIRGEPTARLREGDVLLEAPGIRYNAREEAWDSLGGPFRVVKEKGEARR